MSRKLHFQQVDLIRDALDWYADHLVRIAEGLEKTDAIKFGETLRRYQDRASEANELYAELRGAGICVEGVL